MRYFYLLFVVLISVFVSCKTNQLKTKKKYKDVSLVGEWENPYYDEVRIIIDNDSTIYSFSKTDGGSLIEIGHYINDDSIILDTFYNRLTDVIRQNDNEILMDNYDSKHLNIYKRVTSSNYKDNLSRYLLQDSVRNQLIGWWKMDESKIKETEFPFQKQKAFTINIKATGELYKYINNDFNNEYYFKYYLHNNIINFKRGCEISSLEIISINSGSLNSIYLGDTIIFNKLDSIK